jgi:hypothetical protein
LPTPTLIARWDASATIAIAIAIEIEIGIEIDSDPDSDSDLDFVQITNKKMSKFHLVGSAHPAIGPHALATGEPTLRVYVKEVRTIEDHLFTPSNRPIDRNRFFYYFPLG